MSKVSEPIIEANRLKKGPDGNDRLLAARGPRFVVLTCVDARIDATTLGALAEGEAHVIRNVGGRASDDAVRSLVRASEAFGSSEWFVVHHDHCGMTLFTDALVGERFRARREVDPTEDADPTAALAAEDSYELSFAAEARYVALDVNRIRLHPLVPPEVSVQGYLYRADSGRLVRVTGRGPAARVG